MAEVKTVKAAEPDPFVNKWMLYEDLRTFIKRSRKRTFYVHVECSLRTKDNLTSLREGDGTAGNCYDAMSNVPTTRNYIVRFLDNLISKERRETHHIFVTYCSTCVFIGGGKYG